MERIKQWLSDFQERQRVARLRRQWHRSGLLARLQLLPLDLALKIQLRNLAASAVAANEMTALYRVLLRLKTLIGRKRPSANATSALPNSSHPRCPAPLARWRVRLHRLVVVWVLCLVLRFLQWCLGKQAQRNQSLIFSPDRGTGDGEPAHQPGHQGWAA